MDPLERWEIIEKLGEGSYGEVYKCRDKDTLELVAVKVIPIDADFSEIKGEIEILEKCRSPYIVEYKGSFKTDQVLCVRFHARHHF
jgi:serine/threonine protein kinase